MDAPDLIIPVRMDPAGAVAGLKKVGAAGKKAGDDVEAGTRKGRAGLRGIGGDADNAAKSILALGKAQIALSTIKSVGAAIGSEFKRAADHVKEMAAEFAGLRKSMQEVATLKGRANTTEFTLEEAEKAKQIGLTAQEHRDFQAEFLNYAGAQIGEGGKLTQEQGEEYAGRVAAMMKQSGINPAVGAELAGSLLEQAKGPQDVDKLMSRLSEVFNVLEKGRVPLSRALPQMSEIMGHGVGAEEAARMFNIVAPASPGQEGTAVQAAFRAVDEMKAKGSGKEFGVKQGMTLYESVKAFAENVNARKAKMVGEGKTEQEAEDALNKLLKERDVAADVRERRGLIAGFARQGVELGGFKTYERIATETPETFEEGRRERYEQSSQGKQNNAEIETQLAQIRKGAENQGIHLEMEKARAEVIKEGKLDESRLGNIGRGTVGVFTGVDTEQQLVNEQALSNLRREAGVNTEDKMVDGKIAVKAADAGWRSQESVNAEMKMLLEKIEKNTRKDEAAEKPGVPTPLSVPKTVRNMGH